MGRTCLLLTLAALGGCTGQGPARYNAANERLDQGRASIFAPLGATTSTLNRQDLLDRPGGDNQTLAGALARLPGVTTGPDSHVGIQGQ